MVDDGVCAGVSGVGFFHADVEGVVADGCAVCEGCYLVVASDESAAKREPAVVCKGALYGFLFFFYAVLVSSVGALGCPLSGEVQTLGDVGWGEFFVLIVGVLCVEAVDVVAFWLEFFACQCGECGAEV